MRLALRRSTRDGRLRPGHWFVATAAAIALTATGCGSEGQPSGGGPESGPLVIDGETIADEELLAAARAEGVIALYTVMPEQQAITIGKQFTADTGVEVQVTSAPGTELATRIKTEADAGNLAGDVFLTSAPRDMVGWKDAGYLAPVEVPGFAEAALNPDAVDPEFHYYPYNIYVYLPAFNAAVVPDPDAIKDWDDIIDPQFTGKVGITPAGVGGSGIAQAAFQTEVLGEAWLQKLAAVKPVIFNASSEVAQNLAQGNVSTAIIFEPTAFQFIADGAPIVLLYPEVGVLAGDTYQAVAANAPHPNAARLWQLWSLSKHGQSVLTGTGTRSVRKDAGPLQFPGVDDIETNPVIWPANLTARFDTQAELVAHWNEVVLGQ